jgi:predicted metal-dependent peptidase
MGTLDRTKLLAARFRAARDRPYLASALYALSVVQTEHAGTMAVDRHWRCYVAPAFVAATDVAALAGVWIHEVAHLLRDHHGRADRLPGGPGDRLLVNIAQDCEINDDLLADGLSLPPGRLTPDRFGLPEGLLFEDYLGRLPSAPPHQADCGSGAHGQARTWEVSAGAGASMVGTAEADAIRRQTALAIRQHVRARGSAPDGWRRWAEGVLEPRVDWRRVLVAAVRNAVAWASGAADYTYARPSRRAAAMPGVVLPSLRQPLPRVAMVVDTSGSMGDDDLAAALAEVAGVLRSVGIRGNRVAVLSCDADIHVVRQVTRVEQVELRGGGGTDMRAGISAALDVPHPPQVVIVLTDGYTPWPDAPPRARVIAGLVGANPPPPPAWIETIPIT